jgi:hypothetical protein
MVKAPAKHWPGEAEKEKPVLDDMEIAREDIP